MAWGNYYVIDFSFGEKLVRKLSRGMATKYGVPNQNCFAMKEAFDQFQSTKTAGRFLANSDLNTKIILCAHGGATTMAGADSDTMADVLWEDWGLKSVGLIAFKGCEVGKKNFLQEFGERLVRNGVLFGYLIAYKESVYAAKHGQKMRGFFYERVKKRIVRGNANVAIPSAHALAHIEDL